MTDPIRWGLLGAGGIAGIFAENLLAEGLTVQAVAARDGAKARAFADRFGIPTAHAGYEALVEDPDVDVVYVATTHNFHAAHALLAIEAGKPVLVEKAFTVTAAQARQVADAARERGVFAMEAMWTRFLPSTVPTGVKVRLVAVRLNATDKNAPVWVSPTTRTRSAGCTTRCWPAVPCSTWASTTSRSPWTCSVRPPRRSPVAP